MVFTWFLVVLIVYRLGGAELAKNYKNDIEVRKTR